MSFDFKEYEDLRYLIEDHGLCEVLKQVSYIIEEHAEHENEEKLDKLYELIEAAREVC